MSSKVSSTDIVVLQVAVIGVNISRISAGHTHHDSSNSIDCPAAGMPI
jgi:hypothetical protein